MHLSPHPLSSGLRPAALLAPAWFFLIAGCAQQPVGYIYEPTESQVVDLAYQTVQTLGFVYNHVDQATKFLEDASLTENPQSILPEGWFTTIDSSGALHYVRNYLDSKYYIMRFDREPQPGAIRTPSSIDYQYVKVGSFQNPITSVFKGDYVEIRDLALEYADNRSNPNVVEGWMKLVRNVAFTYDIEVAQPGGNVSVELEYFVKIPWSMKIESYSIDPYDQRGRIVIDGIFPQRDNEGIIHNLHVGGEINLRSDGYGSGEIYLRGEHVLDLTFTGRRGYGFRYDFEIIGQED